MYQVKDIEVNRAFGRFYTYLARNYAVLTVCCSCRCWRLKFLSVPHSLDFLRLFLKLGTSLVVLLAVIPCYLLGTWLMWWSGVRTGQVLHNPVMRSWPFSGPGLLGNEFHKSLFFLFFVCFVSLWGRGEYFPFSRLVVKWSESHSVMSNSLWPHELYRLWNSPG